MPPLPPGIHHQLWFLDLQGLIMIGNIILLVCLLVIYAKNYKQIKSKFALGLIAFVVLLLVQAFTSASFVHFLWGFQRLYALGLLRILSAWFEFAALAILLYISLKPE
ncbi:MAG: hypothetical protein QMD22_06710 [archaeon]|nr:hypothetical protein [archaeon]